MALFNFGKKKEVAVEVHEDTPGAAIKVLGSGCDKCNQLEAATRAALINLDLPLEIEHVKDFAVIATYGVMTTPALVVDGKVMSYGKVLKTAEVEALIQKARN